MTRSPPRSAQVQEGFSRGSGGLRQTVVELVNNRTKRTTYDAHPEPHRPGYPSLRRRRQRAGGGQFRRPDLGPDRQQHPEVQLAERQPGPAEPGQGDRRQEHLGRARRPAARGRSLLRHLREHLRQQRRLQAAPAEPARQLRHVPAGGRPQHQAVRWRHRRPGQAGAGKQRLQARQRHRLRCRPAGRYPAAAQQQGLDRGWLSLPAHQRQHRDGAAWRREGRVAGPAQQRAVLPRANYAF